MRNYQGDLQGRLEFYKVLALLDTAIDFSNLISNPFEAYRCFGYKIVIAFPFLRFPFVAEKLFGTGYILNYLRYFEGFLEKALR